MWIYSLLNIRQFIAIFKNFKIDLLDHTASLKKYFIFYRGDSHIRGVAVVVSVTIVSAVVRSVIAGTGRPPHTCPNKLKHDTNKWDSMVYYVYMYMYNYTIRGF